MDCPMLLSSRSGFLSSSEFGLCGKRRVLKAVLIAIGLSLATLVLDSLFDSIAFHEGTFTQELFNPSQRELLMRIVMMFGAGTFTYFALRLKSADRQLKVFYEAVENTGDTVLLRQSNGQILYANNAASERLGYSRDELLKMNLTDLDP